MDSISSHDMNLGEEYRRWVEKLERMDRVDVLAGIQGVQRLFAGYISAWSQTDAEKMGEAVEHGISITPSQRNPMQDHDPVRTVTDAIASISEGMPRAKGVNQALVTEELLEKLRLEYTQKVLTYYLENPICYVIVGAEALCTLKDTREQLVGAIMDGKVDLDTQRRLLAMDDPFEEFYGEYTGDERDIETFLECYGQVNGHISDYLLQTGERERHPVIGRDFGEDDGRWRKLCLYFPLRFTTVDSYWGNEAVPTSNKDALPFLDSIQAEITRLREVRKTESDELVDEMRGLQPYMDSSHLKETVESIYPAVINYGGRLVGRMDILYRRKIHAREYRELTAFCESQLSGGWGSAFHDREIKAPQGSIYMAPWTGEPGWFLCTQEELMDMLANWELENEPFDLEMQGGAG